jgi:hypothetical protein
VSDELRFERNRGDEDRGRDRFEFQVTGPADAGMDEPAAAEEFEPERFIVKVREANYVPAGFEVRTRIDELMFTAEARPPDAEAASDDPAVESISRARRLHPDG